MTVDGLPTAARMHMHHSACLCGAPCPGIQHHFWDCCIAKAVIDAMLSQLSTTWCTRSPGCDPILQKHIWLMQPPVGPTALHRMTWLVLCLAAINAMDRGRIAANVFRKRVRVQQSATASAIAAVVMPASANMPPLQQGQSSILHFFQPAPLSAAQQQHNMAVQHHRQLYAQQLEVQLQQTAQQQQQEAAELLQQAQQMAVAEFWKLVADFVILNPCPSVAFDSLPADHPVISKDGDTSTLRLSPRLVL